MVESTALEMRRTFTGTVGSNPTLSAIDIVLLALKRASRYCTDVFGTCANPNDLKTLLRAYPACQIADARGHLSMSGSIESSHPGGLPSSRAWSCSASKSRNLASDDPAAQCGRSNMSSESKK